MGQDKVRCTKALKISLQSEKMLSKIFIKTENEHYFLTVKLERDFSL